MSAVPNRVIVLIPAYNEARFIGSVVLQARRQAASVIVVDDGSSDDTATVASEAGAVVFHHGKNQGKAAAIRTGFRYIKSLPSEQIDFKAVVMMDADGQHQAAQIPSLIAPILAGEADIVVGSRFMGIKSRIPKWRIFGQHALTVATNLGSGYTLTDSQSGFRAFSLQSINQLDFESEGFSVESEMQFLAREKGLRIIEAPISANYDEKPKRNPFTHGLNVINGILKLIGQSRPLFFFGGGGFIVLLVGLGWGAYVVDIYRRTETLAVGYTLISVLLSIVGSLGLFTGVMLHSIHGLLTEIKKQIEHSQ
jgi:glycosyltransferase involved in cell wall biosynthesis